MEDKKKGFIIFGDEEPEEELIIPREEEPEPVAPPASAARPVFVALIAFCILGALLFFGYYQLTNRINRMESTGTHEIKGLNKEVDARLTGLSSKLAEQNTEFAKQIETLTKQIASLTRQTDKNAAAISSADKALTSAKQSANSKLNEVESRMSAIIERLDKTESTVAQSTAKLSERIGALGIAVEETRQTAGTMARVQQDLSNLQTRLDAIATDFEALQANRIEAEKFGMQITSLEQQMNRRMESAEKKLQQTVASLNDEIVALEAMMQSFKNMADQRPSTGQKPAGANIIEQEIQ